MEEDEIQKPDLVEEFLPKTVPKYGCIHYPRKCELLSPCCNRWYTCRKCHDFTELDGCDDAIKQHRVDRYKIKTVRCLVCKTEQKVSQSCQKCHVLFSRYFCPICNLFDDTPEKNIYHCDDCGLCRIGNREENTHCKRCDMCFSNEFFESHKPKCLPGAFSGDCPICMENLQNSTLDVMRTRCGHAFHQVCVNEVVKSNRLKPLKLQCPVCQKLLCEVTEYENLLKDAICSFPMPLELKKEVLIMCIECGKKSMVDLHFYGMECPECGTMNTKEIMEQNPSPIEVDEEQQLENENEQKIDPEPNPDQDASEE